MSANITIGDTVCPPEAPEETILPEHLNCKIDASKTDLELIRRLQVFIAIAFLTGEIIPLMRRAADKIHVAW